MMYSVNTHLQLHLVDAMYNLTLKAQAAALYPHAKPFQSKGGNDGNRNDMQY